MAEIGLNYLTCPHRYYHGLKRPNSAYRGTIWIIQALLGLTGRNMP